MTVPFAAFTPAAGAMLPIAMRADPELSAPATGGSAATKVPADFTAALNVALLLGHGLVATPRIATPAAPQTGTAANADEHPAATPNGSALGGVPAEATPVDARSGERRQSQHQDRSAIRAMRSFVERVAGASAPAPVHTPSADATIDPSFVVRDLTALQPEMRVRVERVITRMQEEFGHEVTVAETWRSQTRQDYLHEQGRTRPGPVVTWTQHSKHSDGMAADLVVDGDAGNDGNGAGNNAGNSVAYARLQRVAAEEGLRTLGARDPGHVELVSTDAAPQAHAAEAAPQSNSTVAVARSNASRPNAADLAPRSNSAEAPRTQSEGIARAAAVAMVAPVAAVAPVAVVATVASFADAAPATTGDTASAGRARIKAPAPRRESADTIPDSAPMRISATPRESPATPRMRDNTAVTFMPGVDTASRAERVHALQESARTGPVSGLVLRLDSPDGTDDRVRVDLRGRQVAARIDVPDASRATELTTKLPELARALEARGFTASDLQIRSAIAPGADSKLFTLSASADSVSARATHDIPGTPSDSRTSSDDGAPPRSHHQHPNRHRSRREREGDTK